MENHPTNVVYEEDEGLTFKQIGQFIKKAFPITLITMLCCIILFSAVYAVILMKGQSDTAYVATQLTFFDKNMSAGLDPNGQPFNAELMRNPAYVSSAVSAANVKVEASEVYNNISVTPVFGAEVLAKVKDQSTAYVSGGKIIINGVVYYPTCYQINLMYSKIKSAKLTPLQATAILNHLVAEYRDDYVTDIAVYSVLETNFLQIASTQEFIDYTTVMEVSMGELTAFLTQQAVEYPTESSPGFNNKTIAMLAAENVTLKAKLNEIINQITMGKIVKNPTSATTSLTASQKRYEARQKALDGDSTASSKGLIASLKEQIDAYQLPTMSIIDSSGKVVDKTLESKQYNEMQNQLIRYHAESATLRETIENIKNRLADFNDASAASADDQAALTAILNTFAGELNTFVKLVNDVSKDLKTVSVQNAVMQTLQAAKYSDNPTMTNILLTYLIAIIISFIIGLIAHPIYKNIVRNKKAKAQAAAVREDGVLTEGETVTAQEVEKVDEKSPEQVNPNCNVK